MPIVKWRISYNFIHSLFNYKNDYFVQVQQWFLLLYCRGVYLLEKSSPPFENNFFPKSQVWFGGANFFMSENLFFREK